MTRRWKRGITLILTAVLMASTAILLASPALAADAVGDGQEEEQEDVQAFSTAASIEQQLRAYAKSIDQKNADDTAMSALASYGISGRGRLLSVGEKHALTATIWNSELFLETMTATCTNVIRTMQQVGSDSEFLAGAINWYDDVHYRSAFVQSQDQKGREFHDWRVYGTSALPQKSNAYDASLHLIAGSTAVDWTIERTEVTETEATYRIDCKVYDRFDFSTSSNSGFNNLISGIGEILFREFDWECKNTVYLTVPYSCTHSSGAYRWTYDAQNRLMISDGEGGYTENVATQKYRLGSSGSKLYYHELADPILLAHDQPWVVEYDVRTPTRIVLSPLEMQSSTHPVFLQKMGESMFWITREYLPRTDGESSKTVTYYHGLQTTDLYEYSSRTTYTVRMENRIGANGKNMIYMTISDMNTGEVLVDAEPMDDCYRQYSGETTTELVDTESDWLVGKDLYINYFGDGTYWFNATELDLRIWENGIDAEDGDYFVSRDVAPTCDADGYTAHTCSECGYTLQDNFVDALGHNMGEWARHTDPTCTQNGSERRVCEDCDYYESRSIAPLGHEYTETVTPPTCTVQGYTTHTCTRCAHTYTDAPVAAMGHSFGEWAEVTAPACTEQGSERRSCSECEAFELREIAPTGHDYQPSVTPPTCTEQGYTTYACACGEYYLEDYTSALGHSFGEWAEVTPPTCTEQGSEGRACANCDATESRPLDSLGHEMGAWEEVLSPTCTEQGEMRMTCSVCAWQRVKSIPALGHEPGEAVREPGVSVGCETNGYYEMVSYCTVCGGEAHRGRMTIQALGHSYSSSWTVDTEPTCTETGSSSRHCARCDGRTEQVEIPALGHAPADAVAENVIAPDCTQDGSYESVVYCVACHTELTRETVTTDSSGHTAAEVVVENQIDATCTEGGSCEHVSYCAACGVELSRTAVQLEKLGHDYSADWVVDVQPDCTHAGEQSHVCTRCSHRSDVTEIPATGHSFGEWTEEVTPTCTKSGSERRTCTVCSHSEVREIAATGHVYESVVTDPTCTDQGYTTHTCACADEYVDAYTDPLGHSFGTWETDQAPACTQVGSEHRDCTVCKESETREIAATGHVASDWLADTESAEGANSGRYRECVNCGEVLETETTDQESESGLSQPAKDGCSGSMMSMLGLLLLLGSACVLGRKKMKE